jgi:DNA-binding NtrC family response regulator
MKKSGSYAVAQVLVVDGDARDRENLTTSLEEEDYVCQQAGNSLEALRLLEDGCLDGVSPIKVVITELYMSGYMSGLYGLDLLFHIKKFEHSQTTQVIVLTRKLSDKLWLAAKKAGAYAIFTKPCNFDDLRRVIHQIINGGEV